MPQPPNVLPSVAVSTRGADPLEVEVQRIQKLLEEHDKKSEELYKKLEIARRAQQKSMLLKMKNDGLLTAESEEMLKQLES
jgi:hypothetical protein